MSKRFANILFGLAFACCGGIFLAFSAQTSELECSRVDASQVNCRVRSAWLGLIQIGEQQIRQVEAAAVAENCDEDCTYRVELVTPQGNYPLTNYFSSGAASKQETAVQINQYLQSGSQKPLQNELRAGAEMGWLILVPILFVIIGLGAILAAFFRRRI